MLNDNATKDFWKDTKWKDIHCIPDPTEFEELGTRLLAVFTFGGMKRICLPSGKLRFPMPLTGLIVEVDVEANEGISILMGFDKYGELMPTLAGIVMLAAAAGAAILLFSAYAAAVSRSLPPPEG